MSRVQVAGGSHAWQPHKTDLDNPCSLARSVLLPVTSHLQARPAGSLICIESMVPPIRSPAATTPSEAAVIQCGWRTVPARGAGTEVSAGCGGGCKMQMPHSLRAAVWTPSPVSLLGQRNGSGGCSELQIRQWGAGRLVPEVGREHRTARSLQSGGLLPGSCPGRLATSGSSTLSDQVRCRSLAAPAGAWLRDTAQ